MAAGAGNSSTPSDRAGWEGLYRDALARAALDSERRRIAVVASFLVVALTTFTVVVAVRGVLPAWTRDRFLPRAPLVIFMYSALFIYELAAWAWIGRLRRSAKPFIPSWARFLNAALEISLPTVLIFNAAYVFGPTDALTAPPVFFYPILIILMTLQLDGRVCVFSGIVGAVQYVVLALYLLPGTASVGDAAGAAAGFDPTLHALRAMMIVGCGLTTAFVARQLRRQFDASARAVAQREHAVGVFGQHVSPQVAERLLSQRARGDGSPVGPDVREVCVMFLDIRDFTAFADGRSPEQVMDYLNRLFTPMIDTINRHGGIINKFLGDGFMAVFGAPAEDGQAARHAVHAALELVEQVRTSGDDGLPPTRIGIGLHAGPAVTGELGSAGRKEYTVIGGVVNLASRMEQLNKQFDTRVLASSAVVGALPAEEASAAQPLGEVAVRGQAAPVAVFKLA